MSNSIIQDRFITSYSNGQRDELLVVLKNSQQYDVMYKNDRGRRLIDNKGQSLIDFGSCAYTSFDQMQDVLLPAGVAAARRHGMHAGRARLMGYPDLVLEAEKKAADYLGVEDTLAFLTTTLAHIGIIPGLMKRDDVIFLDKAAHATMYQGAQMARDKGAKLVSYRQGDYKTLETLLEANQDATRKLICVDGVYSMTGDYAGLDQLIPLAEKYDALIYLDDAHGMGFIGEAPTEKMPFGTKGNGIVKHLGKNYDRIMYVAGVSKNFSTSVAVAAVTPAMREYLLAYAKPQDYTQPCTPFSLGVFNAAIDLELKMGNDIRQKVYSLCRRFIDELRSRGFKVVNDTYFPIISIPAGNTEKLVEASRKMYELGIFLTSCPYPTMPRGQEALRITMTSNNTESEVDQLIEAFESVRHLLVDQSSAEQSGAKQ